MAYDRTKKVSQLTIDSMKKLGMSKAIARANSGEASDEEVEAAKRFYGKRVTGKAKQVTESPTVTKSTGHVTEVPLNNDRPGPVVQARANMKAETTQKPYKKNESAL